MTAAQRFNRELRARYALCRIAGFTRRAALVKAADTLITEKLCEVTVGHDAHWVNGVRLCSLCELPLPCAPGQHAGGSQ